MQCLSTVRCVVDPDCIVKKRLVAAGSVADSDCVLKQCTKTIGSIVVASGITLECSRTISRVELTAFILRSMGEDRRNPRILSSLFY